MNAKAGDVVSVNGANGVVERVFSGYTGGRIIAYTEVAFDTGRHTVYPNTEVHKVGS